MIKRLLLSVAALAAALSVSFAHAVDVNLADEAALRDIKGIGPVKAKAIVDERAAGGPFKNADDLGQRVKGLGGQAIERLRDQGLTIGAAQGMRIGSLRTVTVAERPYRAMESRVLYNRTGSHR